MLSDPGKFSIYLGNTKEGLWREHVPVNNKKRIHQSDKIGKNINRFKYKMKQSLKQYQSLKMCVFFRKKMW